MRQLNISKQFTNRENKSLDKYLNEIGKIEMIIPSEEVDLAVKIKKGDQKALDKLVNANLRFVVSVAKQYQNHGLTLGDLINEGNWGLIKAAHRFDETRGFKFISYAVWWIRQSVLEALANQSRLIRLPLNRLGSLSRIATTSVALEQKYERKATEHEIANKLGITSDEVLFTLSSSGKHFSIDAPISEDDDSSLLTILPNEYLPAPDKELLNQSLKTEIKRVISILSEKERVIISLSFGLEDNRQHSYEDISIKVNLTKERIRQIKEKALKKLRKSIKSKILRDYLG